MADSSPFCQAKSGLALPKGALAGKTAFVTGGGTGLGKGMALAFASLGAQVAIASRRLKVLESAAEELSKKSGSKVIPIQMNVRDPINIAQAADKFVSEFGDLPNVIVNNAAGNFISPTERLSPNAFKTIVDTVLMGTAYVVLEFGKRLIKERKEAVFLSITTPYARSGSPFVVPSAASKAGVENLTKSLAAEWGKYGLRFNAIAPGPIKTRREAVFLSITTPYARSGSPFVVPSAASKAGVENLTKSLAAEWGKYGLRFNAIAPGPIKTEGAFSRLDPSGEFERQSLKTIPLNRTGQPEELANLASYMVSDYASWLTGAVIDFDGGQYPMISGAFSKLHAIKPDQWDQLEQMIRAGNEKSKKERSKL